MQTLLITQIRNIPDEIIDNWRLFVKEHKNGTIFQIPEMHLVYQIPRYYEPFTILVINNQKRISGVLSGVIIAASSKFYRKFTSRAIVWGGPIVDSKNEAVALLSNYKSFVNYKVIYSEIRNVFRTDSIHEILKDNDFIFEDHLDIINDLSLDETIIWNQIHKNRRKEIRKAINKGLEVKEVILNDTDKLNRIYELLVLLYKRIALPLPPKIFFQNAIKLLETNNMLKTFVAAINNEVIGFRMVLTYNELIYDWYAASDNRYLHYRPNDVLPWFIFKWGKSNGYKHFDFGGAGKPNKPYSVRNYKLRFGGNQVNYGRYKKIHKPILYFIGKIGFTIYKQLNRK